MKKIIILSLILLSFSIISAKSNWLGKDKVLHLTGSAFITYWNYGVSHDIFRNPKKNSIVISVSITSLFGIGKETSDKYVKKTKWSWHDLVYDAVGISLGMVLINNLKLI
ncbi:MAG TPA: hypothetical protein ENL20_04010 [Candidatus Cloacimonetes bacterium]|nr:hypothetical protein [Candidatus Cloacimonadota bacterium]